VEVERFLDPGRARSTGFLVSPQDVVTNLHFGGDGAQERDSEQFFRVFIGNTRYKAKIIKIYAHRDVVHLRIAQPAPNFFPLAAPNTVPTAGDTLQIISFLGKEEGVFGELVRDDMHKLTRGNYLLLINQVCLEPGWSGAPVLLNGQVVGITLMSSIKSPNRNKVWVAAGLIPLGIWRAVLAGDNTSTW